MSNCICQYEDVNGNDKRYCPTHKREVRTNGVSRKCGYNPSVSKSLGEIVLVDESTAQQFYKASARTNGIVAQGVRMNKK